MKFVAHFIAVITDIIAVAVSELTVIVISPAFDCSVGNQNTSMVITDLKVLDHHIATDINIISKIGSIGIIISILISQLTVCVVT